ncbi:hypothetical protein RCH10_000655 [Variovorax sp. GrIS 2.14]|uniref:hypothetical protein n=1 Tax=Variovorax sp. GrIS 2.14 TaxID=3071709 RepID=UPI0038F5F54D
MSLNGDGYLDTDEALRLLDLGLRKGVSLDMAMSIDNRGTPVEGESPRTYADGKARMDLLGYDVHAGLRIAPGASTASLSLSHLHVVRQSDAATASIASLLRNQTVGLTITVSIYRSGGEDGSQLEPMIEFVLTGGRVNEVAYLTGGSSGHPCEIIRFGYRVMSINSAAQLATGIRGAVRTCDLTAS